MEKDNNNNNYKLYKLVFNNIYLSNLIFIYVKNLNKLIPSYKKKKYNGATFEWCVKNKQFQLLKDKIKCNIEFDIKELKIEYLKIYLETIEQQKETIFNKTDLNLFFNINYQTLMKLEYSNASTNYINIGILVYSIYCCNFQFFEIIINEFKKKLTEKEFNEMLSERNQSSHKGSLMDIALKCGNLNTIKYLYDNNLSKWDESKAIHYSLFSENRNEIILYLIDDIKFIPPTCYNGSYPNYYLNLLNLDFNILKRLYNEFNIPLLFSRADLITTSQQNLLTSATSLTNESTIKKINLFRNILFTLSVASKDVIINLMFKKLNYLISYHHDNEKCIKEYNSTDNYFYTLDENETIKVNENSDRGNLYQTSDSHNNLSPFIKASKVIYSTLFQKNNKQDSNKIKNYKGAVVPLSTIEYSNFDLRREIERMYLFDYTEYLLKNYIANKSNFDNSVNEFTIQFNKK